MPRTVKKIEQKYTVAFTPDIYLERFMRGIRKLRARTMHALHLKQPRNFELGVRGVKELVLFGTMLFGAVIFILQAIAPVEVFLSAVLLAVVFILMLYGASVSHEPADIIFFIPFRVLLAVALIVGYGFLFSISISSFFARSLNVMAVLKSGAFLSGYLLVAPFVYKAISKLAAHISLTFFSYRPYYQRSVGEGAIREYYFRKSELSLPNKFISNGLRGLFIYPDEPLFLPALRSIKKKLGSDFLALSLPDLAALSGKAEYKKYFELISILRPEINNVTTFYEMFPFVVVIGPESVKEYDLGLLRTEAELNNAVADMLKEKELRSILITATPPTKHPWYDKPLVTVITSRPILFTIITLLLAGVFLLIFKSGTQLASILTFTIIFYVDAGFALWNLYKSAGAMQLVEETEEKYSK